MATIGKSRNRLRKSGNRKGVYKISSGYYLNWQAYGIVYREAFSIKKYGSERKALAEASRIYDGVEKRRAEIEAEIRAILAEEVVSE